MSPSVPHSPDSGRSESALETASRNARIGSFDLFRGLGAFGVIFIHVGLVCDNRFTPAAAHWQAFFNAVVPLFLTMAFYFAARREMRGALTPWKTFIAARASRLLWPFLLWDILYLALRSATYLAAHQREKWVEMFSDPLKLLLGGSGMVLYFLPLLFVGLIELRLLAPWLRRLTPLWQSLWLVLFLSADITMYLSNNGFSTASSRAFEPFLARLAPLSGGLNLNDFPPLRVVFVVAAHALRSAPLIVFAFLMLHLDDQPRKFTKVLILLLSIIALALYIDFYVFARGQTPSYGRDIGGMALFLLSLSIVDIVPSHAFLARLGTYAFGIVLCHQVILTGWRFVLPQSLLQRIDLPLALVLALTTFAFAYFLTALAARGGSKARRLFAVES